MKEILVNEIRKFTKTDKPSRQFVHQSTKGCKIATFDQGLQLLNAQNRFKIIREEFKLFTNKNMIL